MDTEKNSQTKATATKKTGRLTDRDRVLCGHLALVRYLTREQLWRLVYPGRWESVVTQRLKVLETLGFVRKTRRDGSALRFRAYDGRWVDVWALTSAGYQLAEESLGALPKVPSQDVGAAFLAHATGLIELYLAMVGAGPEKLGPKNRKGVKRPKEQKEAASAPPAAVPQDWKWIPGEYLRIPLSNDVRHQPGDDASTVRVLQPDAVIEFPAKACRLFVEWETGSNPIRMEKPSALVTKFQRYEEFFRGLPAVLSQQTWYTKAFPDKWRPRVLFVLHSEQRKANVSAALREWTRDGTDRAEWNPFDLLTVTEAKAMLVQMAPRVREAAPAAPSPPDHEERLRAGRVSVRGEQLVALDRQLTAFLRASEEARRAGGSPPQVPAELVRVFSTFRVYAERGRAALAAHGITEAR